MTIYPILDPKPQVSISYATTYLTVVSVAETGVEQRRKKWNKPRFGFRLVYRTLLKHQAYIIWKFFNDRFGQYESFYMPSFREDSIITEVITANHFRCSPKFIPISATEGDRGNILCLYRPGKFRFLYGSLKQEET